MFVCVCACVRVRVRGSGVFVCAITLFAYDRHLPLKLLRRRLAPNHSSTTASVDSACV